LCSKKLQDFEGKQLLIDVFIIIRRHFPDFFEELNSLWDNRKSPQYSVRELHFAAITLFLFKQNSRNQMNNNRRKGNFQNNYFTVFGMKLPHLDTVALHFEKSDPVYLENFKHSLLQKLINKKVFKKFLYDKYYPVAIDGTGISSYDYEPFPECPYKEYKNGKKVWQVPILEAKLVFCNGFSLSLGTEWIINTGNFDKQNCEQKAFKSLSEKIKKYFPRLPILILADGLYPNDSVFTICEQYNWQYIITLKEGNLKSIWEEMRWEFDVAKMKPHINILKNKPEHKSVQYCSFVNGQEYKSHQISVIECIEKKTIKEKSKQQHFVFITNYRATEDNIFSLCHFGRMRWNIENQGFNAQKNQGYFLKHKFSRTNLTARQNYYQTMQIAHLINQLVDKSKRFLRLLIGKNTIKSIWISLVAFMTLGNIETSLIKELSIINCQIRY